MRDRHGTQEGLAFGAVRQAQPHHIRMAVAHHSEQRRAVNRRHADIAHDGVETLARKTRQRHRTRGRGHRVPLRLLLAQSLL